MRNDYTNSYRIKPRFPYAVGHYMVLPQGFRGVTKSMKCEGGEIVKGDGYLLYIKDTLPKDLKKDLLRIMHFIKRRKILTKKRINVL